MRTRISRTISGFTLVEVLVVLAIIGGLIGVAVPVYSGMATRMQMASASKELQSVLRDARRQAIVSGKVQRVVFHAVDRAFELEGRKHISPVAFEVAYGQQPSEPSVLHFYPDGSGDEALITLKAGSRVTIIRVNWVTGRAGIEDG